jgi:hypothetical protein
MGKILYVPLIILPSMPDNVYTGTALKNHARAFAPA